MAIDNFCTWWWVAIATDSFCTRWWNTMKNQGYAEDNTEIIEEMNKKPMTYICADTENKKFEIERTVW